MNKNMNIHLNSKDAIGTVIAWGLARSVVPLTLIGIGLGTTFILAIFYNQPELKEHRAEYASLKANNDRVNANCKRRHLEERGVLTNRAIVFCFQYANSIYPAYQWFVCFLSNSDKPQAEELSAEDQKLLDDAIKNLQSFIEDNTTHYVFVEDEEPSNEELDSIEAEEEE